MERIETNIRAYWEDAYCIVKNSMVPVRMKDIWETEREETERWLLVVPYDGGCGGTAADLEDVIRWTLENKPELIKNAIDLKEAQEALAEYNKDGGTEAKELFKEMDLP